MYTRALVALQTLPRCGRRTLVSSVLHKPFSNSQYVLVLPTKNNGGGKITAVVFAVHKIFG